MTSETQTRTRNEPKWWPHGAINALRSYRSKNTVNGKTFDEIFDAALREQTRITVERIRERANRDGINSWVQSALDDFLAALPHDSTPGEEDNGE